MSLWTRIANALSSRRLNCELNEEYEAHIAEAIAQGRSPEEARRAFGPLLHHREQSRQHRVLGWLESLRIDLVFGLRQLKRNKTTSLAAILSLGLAMGACVGAFRLIDALLWRPLPIAHPERLYALWHHGIVFDGSYRDLNYWSYPDFEQMRKAVGNRADLIADSFAWSEDLTYGADQETEKANVQNVSSSLFRVFGLKPAAGRLLIDADDADSENTQLCAVISYGYWTRRFGRDPRAVGTIMHVDDHTFQIVGVVEKPFTGVETGTLTDIFLPATMQKYAKNPGVEWARILVSAHPGVEIGPLGRELEALHRSFETSQVGPAIGIQKRMIDLDIHHQVDLRRAAAGVSDLQDTYHRAVGALGILVVLVLLIACVNVTNLMTAQAAARQQEMALRISIGAGRLRLFQLVLAESALLALGSALVGSVLAWWSAPFVVSRIGTPDAPVRLALPADWRVGLFALALIVAVTLLFGLLPALRASSIRPVSALKGGESPHARKYLMYGMVAVQVAFCSLVVFFASLFVTTFKRLESRPLGFSPENLLLIETISAKGQPSEVWDQVRDRLEEIPGVQHTAIAGPPLLSQMAWIAFIGVHGVQNSTVAYFSSVTPGWLDTMKISLLKGRDFRSSDTSPSFAIVNETFARTFFPGLDPVGQFFTRVDARIQIVGVMRDTPYSDLRSGIVPVAIVPFRYIEKTGKEREENDENILVRLQSGTPLEAIKPVLRQAIAKAHAGFRVTNLRTQQELIDAQTVRERLLAMLALFFAAVALLLAGIGLFGVLNYTVLQRRREIGIRLAIGARKAGIAALVARPIAAMIALGAIAGVAAGIFASRSITTLFYATKATDPAMLTLPAAAILLVAILAVLPAIRRAIQTDPAEILRSE